MINKNFEFNAVQKSILFQVADLCNFFTPEKDSLNSYPYSIDLSTEYYWLWLFAVLQSTVFEKEEP